MAGEPRKEEQMIRFEVGDRVRYRRTSLDRGASPSAFDVQDVRQVPYGMDATEQEILTPSGWRRAAWFVGVPDV
jgi:hypothetical protein